MIDKSIFSKDYINQKRIELKCDPTILERTIFAFGLLEAMVKSGAEFIFKGIAVKMKEYKFVKFGGGVKRIYEISRCWKWSKLNG